MQEDDLLVGTNVLQMFSLGMRHVFYQTDTFAAREIVP